MRVFKRTNDISLSVYRCSGNDNSFDTFIITTLLVVEIDDELHAKRGAAYESRK